MAKESVEADGRDVREFGWCQRNVPKKFPKMCEK